MTSFINYLRKNLIIMVSVYSVIWLFLSTIFIYLALTNPTVDYSGLGQLVLAALGLPAVLFGFSISIIELREYQAKPDIKIMWMGDSAIREMNGWAVLEQSKHNEKHYSIRLFLQNAGNAIAHTYQITVDIPKELVTPLSENVEFDWHLGSSGDSNSGVSIIGSRYIFTNQGNPVLFPSVQPIHAATFKFSLFPQVTYPQHIFIRYSEVTDKTAIHYGKYRIRIVPEFFLPES